MRVKEITKHHLIVPPFERGFLWNLYPIFISTLSAPEAVSGVLAQAG